MRPHREDNAAGGGQGNCRPPGAGQADGLTTPGETGIAGLGIAATATTRI